MGAPSGVAGHMLHLSNEAFGSSFHGFMSGVGHYLVFSKTIDQNRIYNITYQALFAVGLLMNLNQQIKEEGISKGSARSLKDYLIQQIYFSSCKFGVCQSRNINLLGSSSRKVQILFGLLVLFRHLVAKSLHSIIIRPKLSQQEE
ncbi:MAG: hypothetical protein FJZ61_05615 [Chlamydiae bacterium]|nr:hypothetical protein [Chlamydiota bacterium]